MIHTEFKRAILPTELKLLLAFDRKTFVPDDLFDKDAWLEYESYWMFVDGVRVGCTAFQPNVDFQEDVREDGINPKMKGSLYIASTGILPRFQDKGMGTLLKAWQIAYARCHCYRRIVTNMRKKNRRIISLNTKFGFREIRTTADYYSGPKDATVVMELSL